MKHGKVSPDALPFKRSSGTGLRQSGGEAVFHGRLRGRRFSQAATSKGAPERLAAGPDLVEIRSDEAFSAGGPARDPALREIAATVTIAAL